MFLSNKIVQKIMQIVKRLANNETNGQILATYIIHLIENR